jgi:hypothetical protein
MGSRYDNTSSKGFVNETTFVGPTFTSMEIVGTSNEHKVIAGPDDQACHEDLVSLM